jgi:D-threo-aldose 1-dehydrogenase
MSFDPTERVRLGSTDVEVTRLGLGSAEIGGLYTAVPDSQAASLLAHAWDSGVRYFDTAPLYGYGNAEMRVGRALRERERDTFALSTKVGRLLVPTSEVASDADVDRQLNDGLEDGFYEDTPPVRVVFDYSRDGILRSVEASLARTGLDRIDILYIHDPDEHWQAAIGGAYPALHELREQGVVGAIGAGMNQAAMLARFAREGDFDVFMVAGRYTLLDQPAFSELLPLCEEKGISVVAVGVMNSGILADPRRGARFDYVEAPSALIERAQRMGDVCERHGVDLKAAAIQFPLGHPAVASVTAGVRTIEHFDDYPRALQMDIPDQLWEELRHEGLLPDGVPTPSGEGAA